MRPPVIARTDGQADVWVGDVAIRGRAHPRGIMANVLIAALLLIPLALLAYLILDPSKNPELHVTIEHVVIVSNAALLALAGSSAQTFTALRLHQRRLLFIALGFGCVAGFFSVHALSTPGVPWTSSGDGYPYSAHYYDSPTVGISAYLSILIPAIFFAAAHTDLPEKLPPVPLALITLAGVLAFAFFGLWMPEILPNPGAPLSHIVAAVSVALLAFAAYRQWRLYRSSRLPTQGALGIAFFLLAQAQLAMDIAPTWTLAWWEYHLLMLTAVTVAIGALYIELDRRRDLERFLPATVIDRVLANEAIHLQGERRTVTIMFTDLRNSTALAENIAPEAAVALLNQYVGAMARAVADNGGVLDKYMGDGLMAIFGVTDPPTNGAQALLPVPAGAPAAVHAAIQMRQSIAALNNQRETPIGFGAGIHTGEVVLGAVGIPERADYTAIGDTVNTAARLERVAKEHAVQTVLSADTLARLNGQFQVTDLGEVQVQGRTQPIRVYALG